MAGDQIEWYESRNAQAQRTYKRLKIVQISVGAVIGPLAGVSGRVPLRSGSAGS